MRDVVDQKENIRVVFPCILFDVLVGWLGWLVGLVEEGDVVDQKENIRVVFPCILF